MSKEFKWGYDSENNFHKNEFLNYLKSLDTGKPFPCPNLRVLPEEVRCGREEAPSFKYKSGELICMHRVKNGLSHRCHIDSDVIPNEEGRLEVKCSQGMRIKF